MTEKDKFHVQIEKAKLLTIISLFAGGGSFAMALLILIPGIIYQWAGLDIYSLSIIPFTVTFIFSIAALIFGILSAKAAEEEEEKTLLAKKKEKQQSAFTTAEDVRFTAGRTLANYKKYAPYVFAALGMIVTFVILLLFWKFWQTRVQKALPVNVLHSAFIAAIFMCMSIFAGAFCIGQSHEKEFRWLRPAGAWMVVSFLSTLLTALAALLNKFGYPGADNYISRMMFITLAILGIEFIISFITEFYRPRTADEDDKPVFESRILSLFTEPGGIMRNVADTLDYQFGFKVSRTWIYTLIEKSLEPLLVIWLITLWLFTSIAEVGPNEIGMRERFGKLVNSEPLPSGVYLKLPWPFENIARYPVYLVQEVVVGPKMENDKGEKSRPPVVLWTKSHYAKESIFIVASDKTGSDKDAVPISFLSVSIPVQYKIRKDEIVDFAYIHKDSSKILKNIGERVATKYLASVDLLKVMSSDRQKTINDLKNLMQKAVDEQKLGVDVVYVNLHDAHPPVDKVAPAFQDVIGAMEEKETQVLGALAYEKTVLPEADAEAIRLVLNAQSYKDNVIKVSQAESERFNKQITAYNQMPEMFKLRTYLDFLENDCRDIRKYVMSSSIPYEVYEINMEEKARLDLLDANIGEISK